MYIYFTVYYALLPTIISPIFLTLKLWFDGYLILYLRWRKTPFSDLHISSLGLAIWYKIQVRIYKTRVFNEKRSSNGMSQHAHCLRTCLKIAMFEWVIRPTFIELSFKTQTIRMNHKIPNVIYCVACAANSTHNAISFSTHPVYSKTHSTLKLWTLYPLFL